MRPYIVILFIMEVCMKEVISFLIYFVIIYLLYLLTVVLQKNKYEKYKGSRQVIFFIKKYNLDFNKVSFTKFINILSLTNSFIMSITLVLIQYLPNLMLKLMVAFVTIIVLILSCYKLIGIYIERRNKHV